MGKCKQTKKHKFSLTILISSWRCKYSMKREQFYRLESFALNTDIHMSGKTAKITVDQQWDGILMQNDYFRTSCCSWIVVKFRHQLVFYIATAGLIQYLFESSNTSRCDKQAPGDLRDSTKSQDKKKGERQAGA